MRSAMFRRMILVAAAAATLSACATATPKPEPDLVWPLPPEQPRIKYVESLSRRGHFGPQEGKEKLLTALFGEDGRARERMFKPFAVTTDSKGRVYVTDTGLNTVWVFDGEKKEVRFLGESGQMALGTPSGVAVDGRGVVFVSDTKNDRVFGYDESGKMVLSIGQKDEFQTPAGLAVDRATGRLYVADTARHRVRVYDTVSGAFLFEFGERGNEPGKFNYPAHLFLKGERLYVSDTMNFRVQMLDLEGRPLGTIGQMGANLGQFARPKGVGVDSEGHVYVVDAAFNNYQIFNPGGDLLLFVGRVGTKNGEFWLPAGLHVDERDRIYVVDQYNKRVQVFQYVGGKHVESAKSSAPKP